MIDHAVSFIPNGLNWFVWCMVVGETCKDSESFETLSYESVWNTSSKLQFDLNSMIRQTWPHNTHTRQINANINEENCILTLSDPN